MKRTSSILLFVVLSIITLNSNAKNHIENKNLENNAPKSTLEEFLTKNHDYSKIQLSKIASGHLMINVTLNGVKGKFLLDTGANATIVEQKSKDKFKMKYKDTESSATGAGGTQQSLQISEGNTLDLEKLKMNDFNIVLMSMDHINNAFKSMGIEEVEGVIGADILTHKQGIIDYTNMVLYLKK